jgi:outer membrane lipase/esterase
MATQWLRRAWLLAASASALVLVACGGGSIASQLTPSRIIAFGDAMADMGQNGSRYTVNDTSVNIWTQYVASSFGVSLTASSQGGTSYATGNARITVATDAAGGNAPSVQAQIDQFLAKDKPALNDLVLGSAGTSDVIAESQAVINGAETQAQAVANIDTAASQLAGEVNQLVQAGAGHVVVVGPYNLARSPWATQSNQASVMDAVSSEFNRKLKVALFGLNIASNVLYVDAEFYYNLVVGNPGGNNLTDVTNPVCTSVDPGPGIGTGSGQVNSNLCTTSTLVANADYTKFLWADRVYPTPRGQQLFGDFAFQTIRSRW